jgi:hypothetical protein
MMKFARLFSVTVVVMRGERTPPVNSIMNSPQKNDSMIGWVLRDRLLMQKTSHSSAALLQLPN